MKIFSALTGVATVVGLLASPASASVVLYGTRVVYPGDARDVTVQANNNGPVPVLVQSWMDDGNSSATPEDSDVPFVLSPPLYRLEPDTTQSMRIVYTHQPLPKDKETLYWLNVLEIPPAPIAGSAKSNELRVLFRTRIKVFFRPAGLDGTARDAPKGIVWSLGMGDDGKPALVANNPTPFYVSFAKIAIGEGNSFAEVANGGMAAPRGSTRFPLGEQASNSRAATNVRYTFIDDFGVTVDANAPLSGG